MVMTPQDIQDQQFHVRFRGFDMGEVDRFLEVVAENLYELLQENQQLQEKVELLEKYQQDFLSEEKNFKEAIIAAQKVADEMRTNSTKEAEEILAKARREGEQTLDEAAREKENLQEEIEELRGLRATLRQEMRAVLQSYLEQLDRELPTGARGRSLGTNPAAVSDNQRQDISDLYQKIELPEQGGPEPDPDAGGAADSKEQSAGEGPSESGDVFSMDENAAMNREPAVTIHDDEDTEEAQGPRL